MEKVENTDKIPMLVLALSSQLLLRVRSKTCQNCELLFTVVWATWELWLLGAEEPNI